MQTFICTSILGLCCLAMEILNLRRLIIPFVILGLVLIFGVNAWEWFNPGSAVIGGVDMSHMIRTDHFSVAFSGLAIFLTALIAFLALDFYKNEIHHTSDYLAILIFILCGALILFSYTNMVMLFLGIEIVSISLYIMAGSRKQDIRSNEAGFKYFLMGSFASGILLFGMALMYGASNSFQMDEVAAFATTGGMQSAMFKIGALMTLVAMMFKVAAVPFHFWSPDVYEGSPTLVTALMSTLVKVAMFAAFFKLMATGLGGVHAYTDTILIIVAIATMVIGNLIAITQTNFKRLLAYSGIVNAGYMMLAVLSIKEQASGALLYYSAAYGLATLGAFAIAIPIFNEKKSEEIDVFNGLSKTKPWLAGMLTLCMLSLAGIPPLAGFLGKYYLFSKAIQNGYILPVIVAVIASIIGVYYYFKVILAMYTKSPEKEGEKISMSWVYEATLIVCVLLSLGLGLWPGWLMGLL